MTSQTEAWQCPKDGTPMHAMGRRPGAWRCPTCRGVFLDVETMRSRPNRLPVWAPVVMSVGASVLATVVAQLVKRRRAARTAKPAG